MVKLGQRTMKGERGQVLAGILILLAFGTLLIAPALNYASTNLYAGRIAEENMRGGLAADAGVEDTLWCLKNGVLQSPNILSENVNEMQVAIVTEDMGTYTLYNGELVEVTAGHYDYVVVGSVIEGDGPVYQCTITVSRADGVTETIFLVELGIRLPPGYAYQPNSVLWFLDNLSDDEPDDTLDWTGEAHMLTWSWSGSGRPRLDSDNTEVTLYFYVTGEEEPEGYYSWVTADQEDIGTVGENTGTLYSITATATRPGDGEVTGKVTADVLLDEGTEEIHIFFWRTSPQ